MRTNRIEWHLLETKFTIAIAHNCINVCKIIVRQRVDIVNKAQTTR